MIGKDSRQPGIAAAAAIVSIVVLVALPGASLAFMPRVGHASADVCGSVVAVDADEPGQGGEVMGPALPERASVPVAEGVWQVQEAGAAPMPPHAAPAPASRDARLIPQPGRAGAPGARPGDGVANTAGIGLSASAAGSPRGGYSLTDALATFVPLAIVLSLVFVSAFIFKRLIGSRGTLHTALARAKAPPGLVEVLGRYPIAAGQSLLLLKVDRRVLLIGQSQAAGRLGLLRSASSAPTMTTLSEFSDPDDVASILAKVSDHEGEATSSAKARFQTLLNAIEHAPLGTPALPDADAELDQGRAFHEHGGDAVALWDPARANLGDGGSYAAARGHAPHLSHAAHSPHTLRTHQTPHASRVGETHDHGDAASSLSSRLAALRGRTAHVQERAA